MRHAFTSLAVLAIWFSEPAFADEALDLFKKSETAYRELRFLDAIALLQKAYTLKQDPVLLYNLARAYEGARDDTRALEVYRQYLAQWPDAPDAAAIERRIAALKLRIGDRQALEAQRDDERRRADAHLEQTRAAELKAAQALAQARAISPAPWIIAGAGGLVLGGAVAFGMASVSKRESAIGAPSSGKAQADLATARAFATTANVAYAVGAIVIIAGISWGLWKLAHRPPESTLTVAVWHRGIAVGGQF